MNWNFWKIKKEPEIEEEFIGYVEPLMRSNDLLVQTLQRANDAGLQGRKLRVVERRSVLRADDLLLSGIWFITEKK